MDRKGRDPRLNALEEDFFASANRQPPNHSRARDDGMRRQQHVRVVFEKSNNSSSAFLRGFMNPSYYSAPPLHHEGSFWHFSRKEINDLTLATLAFALALALMRVGGMFGILNSGASPFALIIEMAIWGTLYIFSLGPAFLLHEMAHKFLARHYGCWAEFRADPSGLRMGVLIAALLGFVFMAPGAVMVAGNITKEQNGKIALAGPISNLVLYSVGFVIGGLLLGLSDAAIIAAFVQAWLWGNSILAAFNMIPLGPLDGLKVKRWSEPVFWIFFIGTIGLAFGTLTGQITPYLELISSLI
ncbi:MAG TPA: hypothetical protein HA345_03795 [Candidatus Thalassarchaeaceae archaeon]|nr:MAG TPA: hypothetical protein D7H94_03785 [Candidatus Poseidoniales archaeon]HIH84513.1 hypothetical protein [Candidatus Thalassarchaeaceae archaeon]